MIYSNAVLLAAKELDQVMATAVTSEQEIQVVLAEIKLEQLLAVEAVENDLIFSTEFDLANYVDNFMYGERV